MAWVLVTVLFQIEAGLYLQSSGQLPNAIRSAVSKQQASLVEARCPQNRRMHQSVRLEPRKARAACESWHCIRLHPL